MPFEMIAAIVVAGFVGFISGRMFERDLRDFQKEHEDGDA